MAAERTAAAQPATRGAVAAAQAQQQGHRGPGSGQAAVPASQSAAIPASSGPGAGTLAATPPEPRSGRRNSGSPRADGALEGFAFAQAAGCPTPAPLGNPPRLRIGKPGLASEPQQGPAQQAAGGSITQPAWQGGMGARQSAPKSVAFSSPGGTSPLSPAPVTPGTPLEVRAASEALLLTAAAAGQPGAAPSPATEPAAYLEALLQRLAALNREGYFDNPVDEEEAPGYYSFTQRPLCFADMRDRLRRRQYRTWGDLLADFELICDNALAYNNRRSRVHRAAVTLQHAGRILLQQEEPSAKIAIAALHPDGPKAAAADARREKFNPRAAGIAAMLRSASSPVTPPIGLASISLGDTATTPDASDDALGEEAVATDEEGYSSYSDMEPDPGPGYLGSSPAVKLNSRHAPRNGKNGAHHGKNGATGAVAAAAAATAALPDIGAMLKSISQGATRLLWSEDKDGSSSDGHDKPGKHLRSGPSANGSAAQSAASHQEATTSGPSTSGGPSAASGGADTSDGGAEPAKAQRSHSHAGRQRRRQSRTTAWKEARRGIEWRARWLQLRMQGLQHTRQRHNAALHELRRRTRSMDDASSDQAAPPARAPAKADTAKAAAPKTASPDAAVPADAPAMAAKQRAAGSPGAPAAQEAAAAAVPDLPVAMAAKQRAAASAEAAAAAKPAGPGGGKKPGPPPPPPVVKKPRRVRLPVPGVAPSELVSHPWFAAHAAAGQMPKPPAGLATAAPAAPGDDDVWYAGRCYALLDLIEKQRVITRRMAASMCQMPDAGQQQEAAARGRANGNSLTARNRGGAVRPGSARARTTGPPAKPSKRRRDEMSEPGTPLLTTGIGAPKFVERQQAMEIPLPQVRRLTPAELTARRAAVAAWRARLKQQPQPAAQQKQPAGVQLAAKAAVAVAAGSSSDEESDDETFLLRHQPLEMEERQRFLSYSIGGNMKARAKGGPGQKPKPGGGNLRAAGGSRPDSAPARTATAPPAMTALADAKPSAGGGVAAEADAAGRKGSGSTRRGSRESEKQRIRSRGTTAARSPADGGTQPAAGAAAVAPGVAGAAAGAGAGAAANGKDSAKAQLRKD